MILTCLALVLVGCTATKPLKGGRATMTSKPAGVIEQTVVQNDNPAQVSREDQQTVRTRTYTVPAGSRMEESREMANDAGGVGTNKELQMDGLGSACVGMEETVAIFGWPN